MADETYEFGAFRLMPTARALLEHGRPVRLGSRALDLLIALLERAGDIVSKDQLIVSAWPGTVVDEASLRVHIAAIRKVLGDGRNGTRLITNIPGRGYAFVAPVTRTQDDPPTTRPSAASHGSGIATAMTRVIGRDTVIKTLAENVPRRRLLTVLGPAGIGKTTTAVAVAEEVRPLFEDGVWSVALASVPTSDLVPSTIGGAFGITLPERDPVSGLIAWLRDKHALVMLDNCEHLIDAVAALAENFIRFAPHVHLLATSREPLRVSGEWRHRLAPLGFPPVGTQETVDSALTYPAVQLFCERATAAVDHFAMTDDDVPAVLEICRRLDGVPLALELAAAHLEAFGVRGLASRLQDSVPLSIAGRRTASPRQQTLRAALDWSYNLLSADDRIILRRLAVFQGDFTLTAAGAIAADHSLTRERIFDGVADLVDKSLVSADVGGNVTYYHLLEITRAYALQRLQASGEHNRTARLHAVYFRDLFARAQDAAATRLQHEWHAVYGRDIGNLRAALHWAFSPDGDVALGVALAAAATDVWIALSLHAECCDWGTKAIAQLGTAMGSRDEMLLQCGLGQALTRSRGAPTEARLALERALVLARQMSDVEYQFRILFGLWLFSLRLADLRDCMALCHECEDLTVASDDSAERAVADWVYGDTLYYLGKHEAAAHKLARARAGFALDMRGGYQVRVGVDVVVAMLAYQAVTFWSLGWADRALQAGEDAVQEARRIGHPVSLCIALTAPRSTLLLKMGYLEEAGREIDALIEHARAHSLTPYHAYGLCSKGCLAAAQGDLEVAERLLCLGLRLSLDVGSSLFYAFFQGELAAVLCSSGRIEDGLVEIDAALTQAEATESLWCMPELLRIKGELTGADDWFKQSLDLARRQGALSWELRSAMSLARHWRKQGQHAEPHALVEAVYSRFTEGFATADLRAAREFL